MTNSYDFESRLPKELRLKLLTQITSALLLSGECKDPLTDQSRVVEYAHTFLVEIVRKIYLDNG
jgi:hypothetical protein